MQSMEDVPLRDHAMPSTDVAMMQSDAADASVGRRKQVRFKNIEDYNDKRIDAELVSAYTNRKPLPLFRSRDGHDTRFFSQNHFYFMIIVLLSLTVILQTYRLSIIGRDMNTGGTRNMSGNLKVSNQAGFDHGGRNMLGYDRNFSNSMPNAANGMIIPAVGQRQILNSNSVGIRNAMNNSPGYPTVNFNGMVPLGHQQQSTRNNMNKMSMKNNDAIMPIGLQQSQLQNAQTSYVNSNISNRAATSVGNRYINGNDNPNVQVQSMPNGVKNSSFYGSNNAGVLGAQSPITQSSVMKNYSGTGTGTPDNVNTMARSQYYPLSVSSSSYST